MAAKKKTVVKENRLAKFGVTEDNITDIAEKSSEAKKLQIRLQMAPCHTPAQRQWFSEQLNNVRAIIKGLDDQRTSITKPILAGKRAVDALFNPGIKPFEECEEVIRQKVIEYDRAAMAAQDAAMLEAQVAAERGDVRGAIQAIDSMPVLDDASGHTSTRTWAFTVVDFEKVPDSLKLLNEVLVRTLIKEHLKSGNVDAPVVPGLKFDLDVNLRGKPV